MATRSGKYGFRLPTSTDTPDLPGAMASFSTDLENKLEVSDATLATAATRAESYWNTGWRYQGYIQDGSDVSTLAYGIWTQSAAWKPKGITGLPDDPAANTAGNLEVLRFANTLKMQRWTIAATNPRAWVRFQVSTGWNAWKEVAPQQSVSSVASLQGTITATQLVDALGEALTSKIEGAVSQAAIDVASGDVQAFDARYRVEDDGTHNTVFGVDALRLRTYPDVRNNVALGNRALYSMKRGRYNDMHGMHAGYYLDGSDYPEGTVATRNTGVGSNTQRFNHIGMNNVSMGRNAMQCNVTGNRNTYIGAGSAQGIAHMRLADGEIVNQLPLTVSNNVGIGQATHRYGMGDNNVAVGSYALGSMILGEGNVAVGFDALSNLGFNEHYNGKKKVDVSTNTAWQNLAFTITNGVLTFTAPAGHSLATGFMLQVQVKTSSAAVKSTETQFWYITGASGNTITVKTDEPSTYNLTGTMQVVDYATNTASDNPVGNIGIGRSAGKFMADGTTIANYVTNSIAIGDGATFVGNNAISLGNSSQTVHTYSAVQTRSDERDKKDIEPLDVGLDFIKALRPVSYRLDPRHGDAADERLHAGLIAQEVAVAAEGTSFEGVAENNDTFSLAYTELVPVLIRAVQELASEVAELREVA